MRVVIWAVLAVFTALAPAWANDPGAMALVRKNYSGTGAVTAAFDLSIYWDVREREEKKSGQLLIAPGDRFRVTVGKDAFISDGKTYWQYSERNKQVVVRNFSDIDRSTLPSNMLASFLSGRKFEEKKLADGTAELVWNSGKNTAKTDDGYTAITAVIEVKSGVIKTLRMTDESSNIHTYTFRDTAFNKPPKDDTFQFKAPRGVETLDMREN